VEEINFKFEKLKVWQISMDWGEELFVLSKNFPKEELYGLSSQLRRAADSVALNIAEGSIGQSNPELKRFLGYSIRSVSEVVTCLHKAVRRKYISNDDFQKNYKQAFNLMNMLVAFQRKIIEGPK